MKKIIIDLLQPLRAIITRTIFNRRLYPLLPISNKYGFDRGTPVDRVLIEEFLKDNSNKIKGKCLEIGNDYYVRKYGRNNVIETDILDINQNNKKATIIGDLRHLSNVQDETYDTLVITQTIGVIDEYWKSIKECKRILKKGGHLIATVASMGPLVNINEAFWRFNPNGARVAFEQVFSCKDVTVKSYGNVFVGQAFWIGLAAEELPKSVFRNNDPHYPVIIGIVARK